MGAGVHDLTQLLPLLATSAGDISGIKTAIISAISIVIAAGITALAALRAKEGPSIAAITQSERAWTNFNAELTRRAVSAEAECAAKEIEIERLRDMCWELGHDPDKPIGVPT